MTGGGDNGSFNSGIDSCAGAVPLTAFEVVGSGLSGIVPFGASELPRRECVGDSDLSDARAVWERRLRGECGRSEEIVGGSRSLDFPFPNPLNAEPKFEEDFRSGEDARPYGC